MTTSTTATEATTADQRCTSTASGLAKGCAGGGIGRFSPLMKTARPEHPAGAEVSLPQIPPRDDLVDLGHQTGRQRKALTVAQLEPQRTPNGPQPNKIVVGDLS